MPRYIVKLTTPAGDRYLEWSTVVDAPVTAYYRDRYGSDSDDAFAARMARVEATGVSARDCTVRDVVDYNRAGPNESTLTMKQLWTLPGVSDITIADFCLKFVR